MEGCPVLPMHTVQLKKPVQTAQSKEFNARLQRIVQNQYHDPSATFVNEITEFDRIRATACTKPSIEALQKYYCQLQFLKNRFQIRSGYFHFSWAEAYTGSSTSASEVDFEMVCILYNLGALHSQLGAKSELRGSSEGLKAALTHFQSAAWAFHTLPDKYPRYNRGDTSSDVMAVYSQIFLAQAQEIILQKSILDHHKPSLVAKIAAQVTDFYRAAMNKIKSSNSRGGSSSFMSCVSSSVSEDLITHLQVKLNYFPALTSLYMGLDAEDNKRLGERIAYFQQASDHLGKFHKMRVASDIHETLTFTGDVVNGKLQNAKKENEFIYHERVPTIENLPEAKAHCLVKGLGFEVTNESISGRDIFEKVVPLEAHEASSLYSEEKAKLLRSLFDDVSQADTELDAFLHTLNLEEIPAANDHIVLPENLIELIAEMSVNNDPGIELKTAMKKVVSLSADVGSNLDEIEQMLEHEKEEEASYQDIMGKRTNPLSDELPKDLVRHKDAHKFGSETNLALHSAIQTHLENLKLLTKPMEDIKKDIPSLADLDNTSNLSIAEMRRILEKVEHMQTQRKDLSTRLREDIHADDITGKMVAYKDKDKEDIFKKELTKFDEPIKYLRMNVSAQRNVITALTDANANYAETRRKVATLLTARKEKIDRLLQIKENGTALLDKVNKAVDFYDKLNAKVEKLLGASKAAINVIQEKRDADLAKMAKPKATDPTLAPTSLASNLSDKLTLKDVYNPQLQPHGHVAPAYQYGSYVPPQQSYQPPAALPQQPGQFQAPYNHPAPPATYSNIAAPQNPQQQWPQNPPYSQPQPQAGAYALAQPLQPIPAHQQAQPQGYQGVHYPIAPSAPSGPPRAPTNLLD